MGTITNRELASLIWIAVLLVVTMTRASGRASIVGVLNAFLNIKIIVPLLLFAAYVAGWVWLAEYIGLWEGVLIKDTIIWFVVAGLPLFMQSTQVGQDEDFFHRSLRRIFSLTIFLEFFLNIMGFSLLTEIVVLPIITVFTLMPIVVGKKPEYAQQKRF